MDAPLPQRSGGLAHNANIGFGWGDLDKNNVNILGFVDFSKQSAIASSQRSYTHRIVSGASSTTFPGTYTYTGTDGNSYSVTPFAAPTCAASDHLFSKSTTQCGEVTDDFIDLTPATERVPGFSKATVKLNGNTQAGLEVFASHDKVTTRIAPVPYTGLTLSKYVSDGSLNPYYPGNGITPLPDGVTDLTSDISVRFRDLVNGYREDVNTNTQYRVTGSLEGTVGEWDYNTAVSFNHTRTQDYLAHGYANYDIIAAGIEDGTINPFGDQTAAGTAALESAQANGVLQHATGKVETIDGHASRELGDWLGAGRAAAIALGFEARHESFMQAANTDYATVVEVSTGIDPTTFNAGHRNVYAGFFELNVPITKALDVTVAARHDKYSDFGSTTNPKVSFRFEPSKQFLLRGSFSTGFRAPSLYELNGSQAYGISSTTDDPTWCPDGKTAATGHPYACSGQFAETTGGNKDLKPERAKNTTLGIVLEPINNLTLEADLWDIRLKDEISSLSADTILSDQTLYANYIHRNSTGDLSTDSTECPGTNCGYLTTTDQNLGGVHTNGIDFVAGYRANAGAYGRFNFSLASTWVHIYDYQTVQGGAWTKNVGIYAGSSPVFRWQHNAGVTWSLDPFSVGVAAHYKTGYIDADTYTNDDGSVHSKVSSYATFDLNGTYAVNKNVSLTVGVKNLFDRDPPFSTQTDVFQGGYDPRYTDPTGRAFYGRATYSF